MKYISLLFFLIFLHGCLPDENQDPGSYWGTTSLKLNGESVLFKSYGIDDSTHMYINLHGFNESNILRYEIVFANILKQAYLIDSILPYKFNGLNTSEYATLTTLLSDGDVLGNFYQTHEEKDNFIEITQWENESQEIRGRFNLTFVRDTLWHKADFLNTDTVRITEGEFHTRLY